MTRAWYPGYVLAMLGLVSVLNYYDRNLISILVEPMKRDLHLSDANIGLLSGIGFALMYSILGIPMARLADRYGRARVLAASGDQSSVPYLDKVSRDTDQEVSKEGLRSLRSLRARLAI